MLIGLFPVGSFAVESEHIVSFANPIASGHVGPPLPFSQAGLAPWTLYDDGTVEVGAGDVRGMAQGIDNGWTTEAITSPWQNYRTQVTHIIFTEPVSATGNLSGLFTSLPNLSAIDGLGNFNFVTTNTIWMSNMFRGPNQLTTLDLSGWDVSSVTRFRGMFRDASALHTISGINDWTTSRLDTMNYVFRNASSLTSLDLSNWDTSRVVGGNGNGMQRAFEGMTNLRSLNLSGWDTSSSNAPSGQVLTAPGMTDMFIGTPNLRQLTLGPNWYVVAGANPNLMPSPSPYNTGEWQNSPSSLVDPPGLLVYSPGDLMHDANGADNTWYWRRAVHTVTFLSGPNGTIDPSPPYLVNILSGDSLNEADVPTPIPDSLPAPGYIFAYWESATGSTYTTADLLNLEITADRTFTAIFVPSDAILVRFELNGGLYGGDLNPVYRYVPPNDPITTARVPIPTRPGWRLTGWIEERTTDLLSYAQVGALIITAPRTFVAQWESQGPGVGPSLSERQAYLIGTEDGLIRPNAKITRAEVATIFFRLITDSARTTYWMQENPFSDVVLQNWFNNAVSTMTNAGVFNGLPDGSFAPNQTITRAEMAAVIVRFMDQMDGMNLLENRFYDTSGHWAAGYIDAVASKGWVQGFPDGTFRPNQAITRAEATAMINRISGRLVERTEDLLPNMRTWSDNANTDAWYYFYIQSATNSYRFTWRGVGNAFEHWITVIPARDWAVLERPESVPGDIGD